MLGLSGEHDSEAMRTDERRTVNVLVAKFMSRRDVTANK